MRIIHEQGNYRIVEHVETYVDISDLRGDMFIAEYHPNINPDTLRDEKRHFDELVEREGVYGYVLEVWNSAVGVGWEEVDSCWGFVGQYSPNEDTFNHYIVDELKGQIK